jgi:site-specific recombinase XerD
MDNMPIKDEWLASILKEGTKRHHERGLRYFLEYMKKSPEELIELRKTERNFETRIVLFYQWMQKEKGITENSSRSNIIAVQSFFAYVGMPLNLKHKLPDITMKLDAYKLTLEDLQKLYKYGDLATKAWISLSRDCPARVGDLLALVSQPVLREEMLFKSKKENVVGKVYLTPETIDLLNRAKESLPKTQAGVDKLLVRACKDAGIEHKLNAHLFRKLWISIAINQSLNDTVVKILSFKAVDKAMLTYFLDREDLRTSWEKVIQALPLENKTNGRITQVQDDMAILARALGRLIQEQKKIEGLSLMTHEATMDFLRSYAVAEEIPPQKKKERTKEQTKEAPRK